jgi:uncharacterized protein (TIGR02284 family)
MHTTTADTITPKVIRTLNACIEVCIDGEKGYAIAAANVRDEMLKSLFHKYASQREDFVRALQRAIEALGGFAENEGSTKGAVHRGLTGARIALEGRHDMVILGECERGELGAMAAYDRAFAKAPLDAMPVEVRDLLREQRASIEAAYEEISLEHIRRRSTQH